MVIQIQRIVILVTCIFFYLMTKKLPWGMDKLAMFYLTDKHGELDDFMKRCTVIASTSTRKTLVGLSCT